MSPKYKFSQYPVGRVILAWGVHLLTASGAICGLMAILAVFQNAWHEALVWMAIAVAVDGVDGTFARWVDVKAVLPDFDGALLDQVVDFLNYVVVPALFLHRSELLPGGLSLSGAVTIALASSYQFCHAQAKTPDNFFRGFPSYWNITVFYLLVLELGPWWNFTVISVLTVLIFIPVKYIYPARTERYQRLTLPLTVFWGAMVIAVLVRFDDSPAWLIWGSLLYPVYYVALSLYITLEERSPSGDKTS